MKYREFWIESNQVAPGVHIAAPVPFEGTDACEAIHVTEITALEPLIGMLEQSRNAMTRAFEQTNDPYYANMRDAIVKTLEAIEYNDLKYKHERVLEMLKLAESILEKHAESYEDGPGMFIARQFDDRIHEARKALIKIEELKR